MRNLFMIIMFFTCLSRIYDLVNYGYNLFTFLTAVLSGIAFVFVLVLGIRDIVQGIKDMFRK